MVDTKKRVLTMQKSLVSTTGSSLLFFQLKHIYMFVVLKLVSMH